MEPALPHPYIRHPIQSLDGKCIPVLLLAQAENYFFLKFCLTTVYAADAAKMNTVRDVFY